MTANKRGYSAVGKTIFGVDTEKLTAIRKANIAAASKAKGGRQCQSAANHRKSTRWPRNWMESGQAQGPAVYDYQDEEKLCAGLKYTLPKDSYVPLRNANTKNG